MLNGVLAADEGSARLDGAADAGPKTFEVCRMGVGRTFQVVRSFPRLPVLDNVIVGAYGAGLSDREAIAQAVRALHQVGLHDRSGVAAGQLTNKQLRLMELARALAGNPRLLLLDETLAGLGREECDDVLGVLARLRAQGMTICIIEHTMHAMMRLADRFVVLDHGRVLATGLPRVGRGGHLRDRGLPRQEMAGAPRCLRSEEPLRRLRRAARPRRDVTLSVAEGRFVTLVGPNGAGKSTLFKTISGVVAPVSGSISFAGEDLLSRRASDRAHLGIAHVPEGRQVFKTLTVRENLEMGAYPKAGRAHWTQTLDRIHTLFPILAERAGQLAGTLSGGEQQMLAIGRGLACAPRLLMLDEPSMGLAPSVADTIFERISQIHREDGVTILLVEQRVAEALERSDHGYVLETGHIVLEGRVRDLAGRRSGPPLVSRPDRSVDRPHHHQRGG